MPKASTKFVCQSCGHESPKWMGRCPDCQEWNSLVEEVVHRSSPSRASSGGTAVTLGAAPRPINAIDVRQYPRMLTGIGEFDRVLGGGLVAGSLVLVGGDPGIGKSTLLLQAAHTLAERAGCVLYVSGEESAQQIKLRADRLGISHEQLLLLSETDMDLIEGQVQATRPRVLIIDSIQTMVTPEVESAPGTVSQVRECAARLMRLAKGTHLPIFLVGHVTKEGNLAGPRVLEHMVDTVLYFEGDRSQSFKVLRAVKNRFGSTDELGIFEMRDSGLSEVANPSELFLAERPVQVSGSVIFPAVEGTRPLLVEIQALVTPSYLGTPRRVVSGCDYNRVSLVGAVLEKRLGIGLGSRDIFLSTAGGVRVQEPAADLGVAVSIASSFYDLPADASTVFIGEVGLAGEVRAVQQLDRRLNEALRLGFKRAIVAARQAPASAGRGTLRVEGVDTVQQAVALVMDPRAAPDE